jgi:hypothetical protein
MAQPLLSRLEKWGIRNRLDLAIEHVIAIVPYRLAVLIVGNRPTTDMGSRIPV